MRARRFRCGEVLVETPVVLLSYYHTCSDDHPRPASPETQAKRQSETQDFLFWNLTGFFYLIIIGVFAILTKKSSF